MPIVFKSLLSSSVVNNTFVDKTIDDIKQGKLALYKTTIGESGYVSDVQAYLNEIADTTGQVFEGDANRKAYSSNNYIADGDNRKVAIEKLDTQIKTNADNITANNNLITNLTTTTYSTESISDGVEITKEDAVFTQVRRIQGDGAAVTVPAAPFGSSEFTVDGVRIILRGMSATNTVTINHSGATNYGCHLNGDAVLGLYDELELMYDSSVNLWIEQRRNF